MIVLATALMAVLLGAIIASIIDVWVLADHESLLDELWLDGDEPLWIVEAREEIERLPEVAS